MRAEIRLLIRKVPLEILHVYAQSFTMTSSVAVLPVTVEFRGGAELLFNNKKRHELDLPGKEWTLRRLIVWLRDNLLTDRPELFVQDDTVRPGILVLVNDADWELLGEGDYKLCPQDKVLFLSALHGG